MELSPEAFRLLVWDAKNPGLFPPEGMLTDEETEEAWEELIELHLADDESTMNATSGVVNAAGRRLGKKLEPLEGKLLLSYELLQWLKTQPLHGLHGIGEFAANATGGPYELNDSALQEAVQFLEDQDLIEAKRMLSGLARVKLTAGGRNFADHQAVPVPVPFGSGSGPSSTNVRFGDHTTIGAQNISSPGAQFTGTVHQGVDVEALTPVFEALRSALEAVPAGNRDEEYQELVDRLELIEEQAGAKDTGWIRRALTGLVTSATTMIGQESAGRLLEAVQALAQ